MRTKNARAIDPVEAAHLAAVKALPCACGRKAGPNDAHHIKQGAHFITIPLCHDDCHQGPHGIHGDQALFKLRKLTEQACLNWTVRQLMYRSERAGGEQRRTRTVPKATNDLLPKLVPRRNAA